jgi:hypothetical protein
MAVARDGDRLRLFHAFSNGSRVGNVSKKARVVFSEDLRLISPFSGVFEISA